MTHHRWFVRRNNKVVGPFPHALVQEYLANGKLARSDEISHNQEAWVSIEQSGYFPRDPGTPQPTAHHRWYVRKNDKVAGPFPQAQIDEYLLLGRLHRDIEISQDRQSWVTIHDSGYFPERQSTTVPAEAGEADETWLAERKKARYRWLDERLYTDDSSEAPDVHRPGEPEPMQALRHDHKVTQAMIEAERKQKPRIWLGLFSIAAVTGIAFAVWYGQGEGVVIVNSRPGPPNCAAQGPGVNWAGCDKTGVLLHGSNFRQSHMPMTKFDNADLSMVELSYTNLAKASLRSANLEGAVLRAVDFVGADLTGANLGAADLSYSTLTGAKIDGMRLDGARLDKAAWVDGRICAEGSVGTCR